MKKFYKSLFCLIVVFFPQIILAGQNDYDGKWNVEFTCSVNSKNQRPGFSYSEVWDIKGNSIHHTYKTTTKFGAEQTVWDGQISNQNISLKADATRDNGDAWSWLGQGKIYSSEAFQIIAIMNDKSNSKIRDCVIKFGLIDAAVGSLAYLKAHPQLQAQKVEAPKAVPPALKPKEMAPVSTVAVIQKPTEVKEESIKKPIQEVEKELPVTQQTNPQVEACVMRKVNDYRSQMGQNVPADVLVEYESDCEVNPSQKEPELVQSSVQSNNNFTQPISDSNSLGVGAIIFWLIVVALLGGLIGTKQGRGFIKNYVKNYIDKNRRWDPNSPEFFKKLKEDREAHLNPSLKDKAIHQMLKREFTQWSVESEDMNITSDDDFSRELRDWFEFQRETQNITMDDIRNEVPGKTEELEAALNKIIACRHNPKEYEQAFIEYALTVVKGVRALTVPGTRPKTERAKEIAQAADKKRKEAWAANDVYREKQAGIDKENKRASDIQNHNSKVEYTKNQLQWAKNSGNQVDINRYQAELDALIAKRF